MPPDQSHPRANYAGKGGSFRGRGRGRGRGARQDDGEDYENGGGAGRNKYYPGRSQNLEADNQNGGHRRQRPRTSNQRNQNGQHAVEDADEHVNMPMVQADGIPAQAMQAQRSVPPRTKQAADCPWIDWDLYLPQEDYHKEHEILPWIAEFRQFLQLVHLQSQEQQYEIQLRRVVLVSIKDLAISCRIPDLMDVATNRPNLIIGCIALAVIQAIFGEDAAKTKRQKKFTIRLAGLDRNTHAKDLKASLIGKLICVRGTVVRASGVKPLCTKMAFTCNSCQAVQTLDLPDARFIQPTKCPEVGCRGRQFTPQRGVDFDTETVDWQTIRLQEKLQDDKLDSGRVPRTIECEVTNELVEKVIPGDVVEITGIVKVAQSEKSYSQVKTGNTMYLLYLDVNYLRKSNVTLEEDEALRDDESTDKLVQDSKDNVQLTLKDLYAIEELHLQPQLFKLLVNSFSPAIFGNEMVKAGILFALFGGRRRGDADMDRTATRADCHVLVVGDPGLGKSQMLSAAVKVAPRGVYICGSSGVSTGGLTVTLVRGSGADFALEAGALVLGDQGCCCIDEFDKMTSDHNALLEAMEQQSISIAKAGIICTLPARTSVIAAANPVGGHYNLSKTVAENLKMKTALLSRFDLIFILMDKADGEMDRYLSNHIMALHSGNASSGPVLRPSQPQDGIQGSNRPNTYRPLSERLRMTDEDNLGLIPQPLLRKYIAYARKHVHPRLTGAAARTLQDFYLELRTRYRSADGTPVTTRQLESLIRMAEARARMELREEVTRKHAMDVIEIMKFSLNDAFISSGSEGLGQSQSQGHSGRGKGASVKRYVAELQRIAFADQNNMFTYDQMYATFQRMQLGGVAGSFQDFVDTLNNQNFLLKKGPRTYQLTTVM